MHNFFHLPKSAKGNIDYFSGYTSSTGVSTSFGWIPWEKPMGINMIRITCIGGGGGGGYGQNTTSLTRFGGAGGGSGGTTYLTIPAYVLPDILYISAGAGGRGGQISSATAATPGGASCVSIAPSDGAIYNICKANGGGGGASNGVTTGGAGAASVGISSMLLASYGMLDSYAGQSAGASTSANGPNLVYPATGVLVSAGAAGAGGFSVGGTVVAPNYGTGGYASLFPNVTGAAAGAPNGLDGRAGQTYYQLLMSIGGGGGGSTTQTSGTGLGGNGGAGGLGSGGGGSGCGTGGAGPVYRGGDGGAGLVVIHTW